MSGISKKLEAIIGSQSVKSWSEERGLPVQTVHEWIKHDRMPSRANLDLLASVTGTDRIWWLDNAGIETEKKAKLGLAARLQDLISDASNEDFSKKVSISEGEIQRILEGQAPSLETLGKIARACNVRMSWLIGDSPIDVLTPNKSILSNMEMVGVNKAGGEKNARVVESLLSSCLAACIKLYGADFEAMPATTQLGYAADLYNMLERISFAMECSIEVMQQLEVDGLAQQLQLLIKINKARKFTPSKDSAYFL